VKDFAENDELVTTMIRKDKEAAKDLDVRTEVRAKIRSIAMKKTVNRRHLRAIASSMRRGECN